MNEYVIDMLVKSCEGCKLTAYQDSVGIWTIGIGTIKYPDGTSVQEGDTCTESQAFEYLNHHLENYIFPTVDKLKDKYLFNDKIYAALCSLGYNIGSALHGEHILKALESNDTDELANAFKLYNKAGGVINKGLQNRREIEIKYFTE